MVLRFKYPGMISGYYYPYELVAIKIIFNI